MLGGEGVQLQELAVDPRTLPDWTSRQSPPRLTLQASGAIDWRARCGLRGELSRRSASIGSAPSWRWRSTPGFPAWPNEGRRRSCERPRGSPAAPARDHRGEQGSLCIACADRVAVGIDRWQGARCRRYRDIDNPSNAASGRFRRNPPGRRPSGRLTLSAQSLCAPAHGGLVLRLIRPEDLRRDHAGYAEAPKVFDSVELRP
jgi:hypothetical protein